MNLFRLIFLPPRFEGDAERTQKAEFIHFMTLTLAGVLLVLMLFNTFFDHIAMGVANSILFVLLLLQFLAFWMNRRGYVREMSALLLFVGWVGLTWIASQIEGVRDTAVLGYIVILVAAGFLLGWRAVTLFTALCILAVWGLAVLENLKVLQPELGNPIRIALDLSAALVLLSLEMYFMLSTLIKSINQTNQEYAERLRIEEKLFKEREHLKLALGASKVETWEWNIETGAVSWSDGIEAMFGMEHGQFDGKYETYLS